MKREMKEAIEGDGDALKRVLIEDARRGGQLLKSHVQGLLLETKERFQRQLGLQLKDHRWTRPYTASIQGISQVIKMKGDQIEPPQCVITGEIKVVRGTSKRTFEWATEPTLFDHTSLDTEAEALARCLDVRVETIERDWGISPHNLGSSSVPLRWQRHLICICDRIFDGLTWEADSHYRSHILLLTSPDFEHLNGAQREVLIEDHIALYRAHSLLDNLTEVVISAPDEPAHRQRVVDGIDIVPGFSRMRRDF